MTVTGTLVRQWHKRNPAVFYVNENVAVKNAYLLSINKNKQQQCFKNLQKWEIKSQESDQAAVRYLK